MAAETLSITALVNFRFFDSQLLNMYTILTHHYHILFNCLCVTVKFWIVAITTKSARL